MTIKTLDIDLLRTFLAVTRLGRFRAAAQHLHKTESAVSMQVRRLEELLGQRVLHRNNQGIALTAAGERLLQHAGEVLAAHDRAVAAFRRPSLTGAVRFGVPDEFARDLLRSVLPLFVEENPEVRLDIMTATSGALLDALRDGRLDLAIAVQPATRATGVPLWPTQPVWAEPAGLDLAARDPLPLALHPPDCPYRQLALDVLAAAGRRWHACLESPGGTVVEAAVEAGLAIAVLDRSRISARMRVHDGGLPALPECRAMLVGDDGGADGTPVAALGALIRREAAAPPPYSAG